MDSRESNDRLNREHFRLDIRGNLPSFLKSIAVIIVLFGVAWLAMNASISENTPKHFYLSVSHASEGVDTSVYAVAPPPFSEGVFPCSRCHAKLIANQTRRKMRWEHVDIELHHDEGNRWCLDCHDAENRDKLHLASGKLVDFTESYKLCGQCHGPKLRDWKAGAHGKRTGSWSGEKQYLLCANCHNPHSPRFAPLKPKPAPVPPAATLKNGDGSPRYVAPALPAHEAKP